MYEGGCLCGAVKVQVLGPIESIIHCHCSLCRKNSGTAYATNGFVATTDLIISAGKDHLKSFSLKPGKSRYFCEHCGCPVYSANEQDPSRVRIRLGILDSEIKERPGSHNFVGSRANWDDLDAELPRYEGFEPGR